MNIIVSSSKATSNSRYFLFFRIRLILVGWIPTRDVSQAPWETAMCAKGHATSNSEPNPRCLIPEIL